MGFISAYKGVNAYENALKTFGINYYSLPTDMNIKICSYTNQQYEQTSKMFNHNMHGQRYSDVVTLESELKNSAELVALCILGPRSFSEYQKSSDTYIDSVIKHAVEAWSKEGPDATLHSKIIETVGNANMMHEEFAVAFKYLLEEYTAKTAWKYDVFEEWYTEFKGSAAENNQKLSPDAEGHSLLDYMDHEPLHRAFQDKVEPKQLGKSFAEQYDFEKFSQ